MKTFAILGVVLLLSFHPASRAAENGLEMNGRKLKLNGRGIFKATVFQIKVYEGQLFLENPSHDSEKITKSQELKVFRQKFLRDIPEDKFTNGWLENHQKRCEEKPCMKLLPDIKKLLSYFSTLKENSTYDYILFSDRLQLNLNGEKKGEILGTELSQYLLEGWIGSTTRNPAMRDSLLGLNNSENLL